MNRFHSHVIILEITAETLLDLKILEKKLDPLEIFETKHDRHSSKCTVAMIGSRSAVLKAFNQFHPKKAMYLVNGACCFIHPVRVVLTSDYNCFVNLNGRDIREIVSNDGTDLNITDLIDYIGDKIAGTDCDPNSTLLPTHYCSLI